MITSNRYPCTHKFTHMGYACTLKVVATVALRSDVRAGTAATHIFLTEVGPWQPAQPRCWTTVGCVGAESRYFTG